MSSASMHAIKDKTRESSSVLIFLRAGTKRGAIITVDGKRHVSDGPTWPTRSYRVVAETTDFPPDNPTDA